MRNSSTPPLLRLEDICVKFGFVEALKSVNLSIQRQEVIAIVGDNGAGKSTLIKVIAGFLQPGFGHIYLNGEQVTIPSIREADRMGIASVFQGQEFCDNLDVASNLFLGKEINQIGIRDDDSMNSRARSVLKTLSSAIRVGSPIASLSVGQRQTVAIARTLLNDPQLILLDEPTAALSVMQSAEVLAYIKRLRSEGRSVVMVCHDLPDVFAVSDRIVVIRQGHVTGVHRTVETSYEEIIAEIAGVTTEHEYEEIAENPKFDSMVRQRKLIDRTISAAVSHGTGHDSPLDSRPVAGAASSAQSQVGGTDEAGVLAGGGGDDLGMAAVGAAFQETLVVVAGRLQQNVADGHHTAADHKQVRIEHGGDCGHRAAKPFADLAECVQAEHVAFLGGLGDHRAFQLGDVAATQLHETLGILRTTAHGGLGEVLQRSARGVALGAAAQAAAAVVAVRDHRQVAEFGGHAEGAAVQLTVDHDGAAEAGAHGQGDHVGAALAGTVHVFAPAGAVGVVLDNDRHGMVDQRADVLGQVVVDPGRDVGGEGERLAVGAHVAGGGDADGLDIGVSGGHSLAVHLGDVLVDGVGIHRRGDAPALDDAIVFIADGGGDLSSSDINGERGHGLLLEGLCGVRDSENSNELP